MEGTPKLKRKSSLSLGRWKQHHSSPHNARATKVPQDSSPDNATSHRSFEMHRSPSVISISSDVGIECTPPHKKLSLDDSQDYSPRVFDSSFSPSGLLSQTLAIDSPEVSWRWGRRTATGEITAKTPDSAYVADSSFASAECGSSSEAARSRSSSRQQRSSYELRREEQRRVAETKLRRAAKQRADENLIQRCAKLQAQLNSAATQENVNTTKATSVKANISASAPVATVTTFVSSLPAAKVNDTLDDFLNDSDSDCLLLEATQQVESKIIELTQKKEETQPVATPKTNSPASTSSTREKRSSLYMKFLEDDSPDDWFLSLDDAIQQATTQNKKPRTSFQRFNSMPVENTTTDLDMKSYNEHSTDEKLKTSVASSKSLKPAVGKQAFAGSGSKIKRHVSSTALSPSNSSYRGRQLRLRK